MKAEHRKELQTNVLADRLGRMVQDFKGGPKPNTLYLVGFLVAALVLYGVWKIYSGVKLSEASTQWVTLDHVDQVVKSTAALEQYETLARDQRGTVVGRTAQFQMARMLLAEGLQNLAADPKQAATKVVKARERYAELTKLCADAPLLLQEAMMARAKAEEALIGVPDPEDKSKTSLGSLDQALKYYEALAKQFPNSFQGKAAQARVKELEGAPKTGDLSAQQFYGKLGELLAKGSDLENRSIPSLPFNFNPLDPSKPGDKDQPKLPPIPEGKADAPKADTPKADEKKAEPAKTETPKADAPKTETPKSDTRKAETPKAEEKKADAPKAEQKKADEKKPEPVAPPTEKK